MRKLLFGIATLAALAFATPQAALAAQHGGGGGSHASGGHGGGGGGRSFGGGGGRSFSGHSGPSRSFSGSNFSNRGMTSGRSFSGNHARSMNRNFNRNLATTNNRVMNNRVMNNRVVNNRIANQRIASSDRRHHRHHRHFRNGIYYWGPDYYYDDYAAYDGCYQYLWTRYGYRYVNTCSTDYYSVY